MTKSKPQDQNDTASKRRSSPIRIQKQHLNVFEKSYIRSNANSKIELEV